FQSLLFWISQVGAFVQVADHCEPFCFNPCCSGSRKWAKGAPPSPRAKALCFNPCCSGSRKWAPRPSAARRPASSSFNPFCFCFPLGCMWLCARFASTALFFNLFFLGSRKWGHLISFYAVLSPFVSILVVLDLASGRCERIRAGLESPLFQSLLFWISQVGF